MRFSSPVRTGRPPISVGALGASVAALLVASAAVAATVVHTTTATFNLGSNLTNIDTSGNELSIATRETADGDWIRRTWNDVDWEIQVQKDNQNVFSDGDLCLVDANNASLNGPTQILDGAELRTGLATENVGGTPYVATLPPDEPLVLPATITTVEAVRFVTSGARIAAGDYTVTFDYGATEEAVVVPIELGTVVAASRDDVTPDYEITGITVSVTGANQDEDANLVNDCAGTGGDVVLVENPQATTPVDEIRIDYVAKDDATANLGWLGGPIAVSVITTDVEYDATFLYSAFYKSAISTTNAVNATANARYYRVSWTPTTFPDPNSEVEVSVQCGNDTDADGTLETGELSAAQSFFLSEHVGSYDLPTVCVGRYLVYEVTLVDGFLEDPKVESLTFEHELDADSDGYGKDGVTTALDCNDTLATINPGVVEIIGDGIDQNCGGELCYVDADNDEYRTIAALTVASTDADCNDVPEAPASNPNTDCNDSAMTVNPGATEIWGDEIDQDCNGGELCWNDADNDDNAVNASRVSTDVDCDDANEVAGTPSLFDCDDTDPGQFHGNTEVVGDGKDQDCVNGETCFTDADGDNARAAVGNTVSADEDCLDGIEAPSTAAVDCDDGDGTSFPGALEIPGNGVNNDCLNGEICYADSDNDGFFNPLVTVVSADVDCSDTGESLDDGPLNHDCNDAVSTINPAATDVCGNGVDDNCNGEGDNGFPSHLDDDGDLLLYAEETSIGTSDCDFDSDNDTLTDFDEHRTLDTNPLDNDSDSDNMLDNTEVGLVVSSPINTDGDALIDALDNDDDNDGILSILEDVDGDGNPRDDNQDADGLVNVLDTDDDGDGILTALEDVNNDDNWSNDNIDLDTLPDWLDMDDDNDDVLTSLENLDGDLLWSDDNTDGDALPNYRDADDDGDGVLTSGENVDGVGDATGDNTDGDAFPNFLDTDDDGDGILTTLERTDLPDDDEDNDNIKNWLDLDSDADNVTDAVEGRINSDGDTFFNYVDDDSDNDTVTDLLELLEDLDTDGLTNRIDPDDDGDGIQTLEEQGDIQNVDADGILNYRDTDSDGDGYTDAYEWTVFRTSVDDDADGNPNYVDLDSDADTLNDVNELGTQAAPIDSDGDGVANRIDSDDDNDCVLTRDEIGMPLAPANFDGDAQVNYLDTDDDNDGEVTCSEDPDFDLNPHDDDTDIDGQKNYLDTDDDNDGLDTLIENAVSAGRNVDSDGLINSIDIDSDGDGWYDDDEAPSSSLEDNDGDGDADFVDFDSDDDDVPDDLEGSSSDRRDTDGDNILDRLDEDDDGDQIPTVEECSTSCGDGEPFDDDFDGDLLADYEDEDDDDDGVLTFDEDVDSSGDPRDDNSDGNLPVSDTFPDYLDEDDDNDTIDTIDEDPDVDGAPLNDDTDGDGSPNFRDEDDDGDFLLTYDETLFEDQGSGSLDPRDYDFDGDGRPNFLDVDDDDDLVDTTCEVFWALDHLNVDLDGDTVLDGIEFFNFLLPYGSDPAYEDFNGGITGDDCFNQPWDRDSDGTFNVLDADDDNDGLLTGLDERGTDLDCLPGTAVPGGDLIPDYLDTDSDNDGLLDSQEALGDSDEDYIVDFLDCLEDGCEGDADLDGIQNCDDDALCAGTGGCSIDPDIDNDLVIDGVEVGVNLTAPKDSDGDGTPDYSDSDDDGDLLSSAWENDARTGGCVLSLDPDKVGLPDLDVRYDVDAGYWYFLCIDQATGAVLTFDFGGNDLSDYPNLDAAGTPLVRNPDTIPNFLDTDDDGDGQPTLDEGMGDRDGDGVPDGYDPYDFDGPLADPDQDGLISEVETGALGTQPYNEDSDGDKIGDGVEVVDAASPQDFDGDSLIDALDADDDNDSLPTSVEGTQDLDGDGAPNHHDLDSDGDGKADQAEGAELDSDCDGLVDAFDAEDADGPCLGGVDAQPGAVYVNQGCGCDAGSSGSSAVLALAALLGVVGRRRVATRHPARQGAAGRDKRAA